MWRSQYEICRRNTKLMGSLLCLMKKKGEKERCSLREKWVTNDSPDTNAAVTVLSNSVHLLLWKQPSLPLFFFHLKYSLYPALSVIPFCKTENHLLSSVSLYLKKKNHNASFSHLISPFLTSNVINTLLFFFLSWNRNSQMLEHLSNVSECMFDSHLQRKERRGHISENWPSQIFLILHFKYHNEVFEPI